MGLTSYQKLKILTLSILLLVMALFSAQSHAASLSRPQLIEQLQAWKNTVTNREFMDLREQDLQIQFINRLIFQSESKYHEQDLQSFMQKTLTDLQETDDIGYFLENINESLTTLLEKNENVLSFMMAFLEFSSIQEPATAAQFAEIRNYYDGHNHLQAQTMNLDEAADYLEQKEEAAAEFESDWVPTPQNLVEQYKDFKSETLTDSQLP
ncbi:MAG: hypothetical protein ACXWC9_07585 [Pseudobdellovibrionaceae bacterium]